MIENDKLLAQDAEGNIYCVDAKTAKKYGLKRRSLALLSTSSGIVAENGVLYAGCAAGITAYDIENGNVIWENIRNHGEASPAEFVVAGDKLLIAHIGMRLLLLIKTGKSFGKIKTANCVSEVQHPPLLMKTL